MDSNLNIDIKDYNGPLDVLLELVHKNKFDLKNLEILSPVSYTHLTLPTTLVV